MIDVFDRIAGLLIPGHRRHRAERVGFTPGRQPYGKGTGRASYDVVQRRRAANRRARASRRINRGRR